MRPGSLRIVAKHSITGERNVYNYEPGQEDKFFRELDALGDQGFTLWLYEMTDKGWTEF